MAGEGTSLTEGLLISPAPLPPSQREVPNDCEAEGVVLLLHARSRSRQFYFSPKKKFPPHPVKTVDNRNKACYHAEPRKKNKVSIMLDIIITVLLIMAVLFAFALPGFLLRKTNLVRSDSLYSVSNILLCFAQPMLIIEAFAVDPVAPTKETLLNFLWVLLFSFAALFLTFFAAKLVFLYKKGEAERKKRDILVFVGTFSNCAFVGIPFVDMFTGGDSEAMMYITVFNVAFNLLIWTLGAYLITQDKKEVSLKKALLNPCTVGSVIGFLLFLVPEINIFNMEEVEELQQIVTYAGGMTAPLSMLVVGVRMAELSPKQLFGDKDIYLAAFTRLVLSMALTYLLILPFKLAGLFADAPYVLLAPVIAMAMPPAASVVAFAEKKGGEKELAAAAYATGTLLSIVTLPVAMMLLSL